MPLPLLPAPLRRLFAALILACFAASATLAAEPEPIFSTFANIIPSRGQGGFSDQGNLKPEARKDEGGALAAVHLPITRGKSTTLTWWYAGHVKSRLADWPRDKKARLRVVVRAERDTVLDVGTSLQTDTGSLRGGTVSGVTVPAGIDTAIYPPLPSGFTGGVSHVRVTFSAKDALPPLTVTGLAVGSLAEANLALPGESVWRSAANPVRITGRAEGAPGENVVVRALDKTQKEIARWTPPLAADGAFAFDLDRAKLPPGVRVQLVPAAPGKAAAPGEYSFFNYPLIDPAKRLPRIVRDGRHLVENGRPYAFLGVNYTQFMLGFSRRADFELLARNFQELSDWGVQAVRVPLALSMIQPAPGVFPDSPDYAATLRAADLDHRFFDLLRYAAELGHHHGIRLVFDWHESAMDPYRYFIGGNDKDRGTGKPGSPLAWLAMPPDAYPKEDHPVFVLVDQPRQVKALLDTTRWLAGAFKDDTAILGFEVPYNEPHERSISNDLAWRRLTAQSAAAVKAAAPDMLAFGMPSGWGHENVFVSSTWLPPDQLDGMGPHFYVGNGPIPVREDANKRKYPYLAREVEPSLGLGLTALALPYSNVGYPVYNGEGGGHGAESFLPDLPLNQATRIQIEAQIFQTYATGMTGYFEWTMWNDRFWQHTTLPNRVLFERYSPVFRAGPRDLAGAKILFVQHPAAESNANGHNHAAVAFARAVLDLHLQPVHYMTDQQLVYTGQTMFSRGFEQVDASGEGLGAYSAIIVDTRNMDKRALDIVRGSGAPVLEFDAERPIDVAAIGAFLEKSGVVVDRKTSTQFQLVEGPAHLLVYRRTAGDATRIYPRLAREGVFSLVAESGATVFTGTADTLAAEGVAVELTPYASAIFRIEAAK